ncbi:MAG TPA: T9SS type A sorting domain-containing protein [Chitinophaga sp.]|uniref:Ig-like domain-containing protein n=1 Tax=Chitinophaga sp. TaxID=1869181 RepID=UPI002CAC3618|nr:T9SS type A sorting domain-containing protein [Chitinophaga sp.]HVI46045.1 T9SS type A sorting domain-containing protein [Chitinophaga sp.]
MYNFYKVRQLLAVVVISLCHLMTSQVQAQTYATSQTNGVNGICLLCGVLNPDNPVNNTNLTDYSTFNITAGLLGVIVHQTLIFPSGSSAGCDSLVIGIGSGNALLSVNLLGAVTVQTFNGNTANNDLQSIGTGILRLLQANNRGEVVLKPQQPFDRVKVSLNSSLLGLLNSFQLYYAYRKPGIPTPIVADSVSICSGDSAVLNAVATPGAGIRWYNTATGGSMLATGNRYVVKPAVTTTYYAEAISGTCISSRKAVRVIVNPKPADPDYTVPMETLCGNTIITVDNFQQGINYNVRVKYTAIPGLLLDTSYVVINSNLVMIKDINYATHVQANISVQAVNAITGCKSDSVAMAVIFGGHAGPVNVDADSITICKGDSTTLHAYMPNDITAIIRWYDAPVGGNLLYTGPYYKVKPTATTTYYANAGFSCEYIYRKPVKVIVRKLPSPVYTVPQGFICNPFQLNITSHQAGFNYKVRLVGVPFTGQVQDTSFTVINSNIVNIPRLVFYVPAQTAVYIQAVDPVTGCRSDSVKKTFTFGASASYPHVDADSVEICRNDSITLHAFIPDEIFAVFRWYNAPAGGSLLFTGSDFKVSPSATTIYYVSAGFECEYPVRRPVKVVVKSCYMDNNNSNHYKHSQYQVSPLEFYPNPSSGNIQIRTRLNIAGSRIIITNASGMQVHQQFIRTRNIQLPGSLSAGIYIISLITVEGNIYSGKLIIGR